MVKSVAVATAVAFSTLGLVVAAQAADPNFGNINEKATGSITIYKHESNPSSTATGAVGDKTDTIASASKPIKGVKFRSFKAKDLALTGEGSYANWQKVSGVTVAKLENACNGVTAEKGTPTLEGFTFEAGQMFADTDDNGKTVKGSLGLGAYLVCEVESPARVVSRATPFLVTIPHPDTVGKKWNYDVTVYPKNTVSEITKTIEAQKAHGLGQGSEIHWPVTVTLPKLATDEHIAYLIVEDGLTDSRYATRGVASVKLLSPPEFTSGTELVKTADYQVHNNGNKLAVGLTKAGIEKAENVKGGKLQVTYKTTLTANVGDGILKNKANLRLSTFRKPIPETPPTNPTPPPGEEVPPFPSTPPETPEVVSKWGGVKIKKVDADSTTTGLKGAQFKIYAANDNTAYADSCTDAVKEGAALSINGHDTFGSNESGEVDFGAVFVTDSENDPKDKPHRCYIIEEVVAPDGYVLPSDNQTKVKVVAGSVTNAYTATVTNSKTTVPNLPLTGANGRLLMLLIGGGIIATCAGLWVVYRRKQENK